MSTKHVPSGQGRLFWVGDKEFVTLKATGEDTDGAYGLAELVALPGAEPQPHVHRGMDELYCVLEGELEVLDGARTFTAQVGSVFHIPRGTLHAWRNATSGPVRALVLFIPGGFEGIIEEVGVPGTLSSPPPAAPRTAEDLQWIEELGRKYGTEYPNVSAWYAYGVKGYLLFPPLSVHGQELCGPSRIRLLSAQVNTQDINWPGR